MISLNKWGGRCIILSPNICVPKKTRDINVKVFNMITNKKNEAKAMAKHISCNCKCKFNITTCNLNQKWNNETCQCECKNYRKCKKDYRWNPRTIICENGKYFKSIADTSVITCVEIISAMNIVSSKMKNNVTTNVSINFNDKKVRSEIDCYILHIDLLAIILLLITNIICYDYAKHMSKQKSLNALTT